MRFTDLFINRPVMTTLVMLAILLFGISAFRQLPMSDLPNVDFPTIQVMAALPGASPETMAAAVATPLERQFSTIAGIDSMLSTSALGTHTDHAPVRLDPEHRRRRPGRAGGDHAGHAAVAAEHAQPADVPEGQPGRPADSLPRPDQPHPAPVRPGRVRRDADGPADLHGRAAWPRSWSSARRNTPSASSSTRWPSRARRSGSTRWPPPSTAAT